MDSLARRRIGTNSSDNDDFQEKAKKSKLWDIFYKNSNFCVPFSEFEAASPSTVTHEAPGKCQLSQPETDGSCRHLLDDVCVGNKRKI